jgi:uncharacterized protein YqeY
MPIEQQLKQDQVTAMRAKDKVTLNAIRSVQGEIATAKSAPGFKGEVDDSLYTKTITTYVKRISKSKTEYDAMGEKGAEQSGKLAFEIDYLSQFLPKVLGEEATRALVAKTMADLGAGSDTPGGKIIGAVMRSGEDVDGALVNRLVNEALES